jgi:hypothetical protein
MAETLNSVKWGPGREQQFVQYIEWELRFALQARLNLERQWRSWLEQYRAPAKQPMKKFPFEGAANYIMPTTATDADQLLAKFLQTIHAPDNLWTLEPMNESWVDVHKPLQDALGWIDKALLNMWDVNKRVFLEMLKLGTGVYKTGWLYEQRPIWTYDERGKRTRAQRLVSRPFVDHVRLADFVIPSYAYALQPDQQGGAPWVGERLRINVDRLRSLAEAQSPFLPNIDRDTVNFIVKFMENNVTLYDAKVQDLDFIKLGRQQNIDFDKSTDIESNKALSGRYLRRFEVELWEIHARFPTGGPGASYDPARPLNPGRDDSQDDIIVWFHLPTRRIVRAVYNYYHHGQRPYDAVRYFPGEGFYGIGLCEQKEMFQTVQTELVNFTIDNVLLVNSRGIAAKAGSNIVPGEPIYPGKIWITDGPPKDEFMPFQLSEVYQSLPTLIGMIQTMGEKRTGISDIQIGNMSEMPGRTPATTMLSMLQEGNRRPDLTLKDMRYSGLSVVGLRLIQNLQQFIGQPVDIGQQHLLRLMMTTLGNPGGQKVAEKLLTPLEPAELGIGVHITATSQSANKEVAKQNFIGLMQLAGQVYPQVIQLLATAQQAQGTPIAQVATTAAGGIDELFRRTLEEYDIRNPEKILPLGGESPPQMGQPPQAPGVPGNGAEPQGGAVGPLAGAGGFVAPLTPGPRVPGAPGSTGKGF